MSGLGVYLAFRLAAAVVGIMPEPVMRRCGEGVGWVASFLAPARFRVVRRNLVRAVGEEAATPARVRAMFASYGRYWAETFWVRPRRKAAIVAHSYVERDHLLIEAAARGNGVILALPHMGNWEAAGAAAEGMGVPVLAAAEALANRRIVDWFVDVRRKLGIEVVIVGSDRRATGALLERLRKGGVIALVSDRDLSGRGIPVVFFGEETTMPAGPVALADRSGATLFPVGSYFKAGRGHHYFVGDPVELPPLESRDERLAAGAQALAAALEEFIRRAPDQWHLFQANWPSDRQRA